MKAALTNIFLVLSLTGTVTSCEPEAADTEIEQMCDRLLELRGKAGDKTTRETCIAEARKQGVSKRQATCRISAINKQEYWNRCRTGEPRGR